MTKYTQYHIIDPDDHIVHNVNDLDSARTALKSWYKYGPYTPEYVMSLKIKRVTFVEVEESSGILPGLLEAPETEL